MTLAQLQGQLWDRGGFRFAHFCAAGQRFEQWELAGHPVVLHEVSRGGAALAYVAIPAANLAEMAGSLDHLRDNPSPLIYTDAATHTEEPFHARFDPSHQ